MRVTSTAWDVVDIRYGSAACEQASNGFAIGRYRRRAPHITVHSRTCDTHAIRLCSATVLTLSATIAMSVTKSDNLYTVHKNRINVTARRSVNHWIVPLTTRTLCVAICPGRLSRIKIGVELYGIDAQQFWMFTKL